MTGLLTQLRKVEKKKTRSVVFIRHGETIMNGKDVVRGWTETPLDQKGENQAYKLGKELKDSTIDCIIASELFRTLETALCVSCESGIPLLATDVCLHTWNVGEYTGKPCETVDPVLERIAVEEPDKILKGGESFDNFKYRFLLGIIALLNQYQDKTIAFVTHGRNLAVMNAWKEAGYPDTLELDYSDLGYDKFKPATAHLFEIASDLLI